MVQIWNRAVRITVVLCMGYFIIRILFFHGSMPKKRHRKLTFNTYEDRLTNLEDKPFGQASSNSSDATQDDEVDCEPGIPCKYPEIVDFRVIVLTYKRAKSLLTLLETLNTVELDGDSARLEIWIDRNVKGEVDSATLKTAKSFKWSKGPTRVHVQKHHVGIYGQWIDTWSPANHSRQSREIGVIFEDDMSASPFIYRWLKAVHKFYGGQPEFFGASLISDDPQGEQSQKPRLFDDPSVSVFYQKFTGTWGTSPTAHYWHDFQKWFHRIKKTRPDFKPYVPGTILTSWYKQFEKANTSHNMWSQWMVYYAYKEHLFAVYNNLELYNNNRNSCLTINRRVSGLHYHSSYKTFYCTLLNVWNDTYIAFPSETPKTDWSGKIIKSY